MQRHSLSEATLNTLAETKSSLRRSLSSIRRKRKGTVSQVVLLTNTPIEGHRQLRAVRSNPPSASGLDPNNFIYMSCSRRAIYLFILPIATKLPFANSVYSDETPSNSASHPDSSCLTHTDTIETCSREHVTESIESAE